MIITDKDRKQPLMAGPARGAAKQGQDTKTMTFYQRCRAARRDPNRIRQLVDQEGMTLEEALAVPPMDRSAIGRTGKRRSYWKKLGETR